MNNPYNNKLKAAYRALGIANKMSSYSYTGGDFDKMSKAVSWKSRIMSRINLLRKQAAAFDRMAAD